MLDSIETVAGKLAENEAAIGTLYALFAAAFPQDADLWTSLARDEQQHARWVRQAVGALAPEALLQPMPSTRLQAVTSMTRYVASVVERCRRGELTRLNALAIARDLETSLLEDRLLDLLTTAPLNLADVESALVESTTRHRVRIADALKKARL